MCDFIPGSRRLPLRWLQMLPSVSPMCTFTKVLDTLKTMNGLPNGMIICKLWCIHKHGQFFCFSQISLSARDIDMHGMPTRQAFKNYYYCGKKENTQHELCDVNKFLSVLCGIVNYRHDGVQQISRTFSSCMTETLYPFNSNSPFPPPPAPGNHHSTFCFNKFDYFRYLIQVESCSVCPSVTDFFHLA